MISFNWNQVDAEMKAIAARFDELPRHIAKKHIRSAIGQTLKPGISALRALTPPTNTRRGRRKKGEKRTSTGDLRRSVKVITKYKGRNKDGFAYGVIGYKGGEQSLKALRLEFGRKHIEPRRFMQKFYDSYKSRAQALLAGELRKALPKAVNELRSGKNPTRQYSAGGSWRAV